MLTRKLILDSINSWAPMCGLSTEPVRRGGLITDAGETAFFARQLEDISVQLYNTRYPDLQGRNIVSVKTDINPGADFHVWRGYDFEASVDETDDYTDDIPGGGDLEGGEKAQKITGIVGGYGFSIMDIRRAQFAGVPLDAMKAKLARDTMERKLDLMMAIGSKNRALNGIYGFYNNPSLPTAVDVSAQNTGAGPAGSFLSGSDGTRWDMSAAHGKTPNKLVADLNLAFNTLRANSKFTFGEDGLTLVLDSKSYDLWNQTPANIGDTSLFNTDNVMTYVRKCCGWIKNVKSWNRGYVANGTVATAGTSAGTAMAMIFEDKEENGQFLFPQPFEQFPPQLKNMKFSIGMHMRVGGYIIRRPLAYQPITKVLG